MELTNWIANQSSPGLYLDALRYLYRLGPQTVNAHVYAVNWGAHQTANRGDLINARISIDGVAQ